FAQRYRPAMELQFRTGGDAAAAAAAVRSAVHGLDPRLPVLTPEPLTHLIADALLPQRIGATLTLLFGLVGLLLAGVGIYGVLAYMAAQRTREIGIRVALGAGAGGVLRLILGRGARLVLVGLAVGLAVSIAVTRFIASLLYGVSAIDPIAIGAAMVLLAAVALLASYLPARRATRVDPVEALRAE
ncbi:MAG TPA: FtsX-like permease family protein, partial [Longimicrobiaceae bacterium]|nr:FtsX-like permease family protein [Longimicrobiaceae bacterium]